MKTTFKVLIILGVLVSLIQVGDNLTEYFTGDERIRGFSSGDELFYRILVYWFMGVICIIAGWLSKRWHKFLTSAFWIGGGYLLVLGANGGLWASDLIELRSLMALLNLMFFIIAAIWIERKKGDDLLITNHSA